MANFVECKISGLADLERQFAELKRKAKRGSPEALRAGADLVYKAMRQEAPQSVIPGDTPGFLKAHINVKIGEDKKTGEEVAYIGPDLKADYPLREGGYKRAGAFMWSRGSWKQVGRIQVKTVARWLEYGTKKMAANPFITRAFLITRGGAESAIVARLKKILGLN